MIAIIPIRSGSKTIKNKNIKILNGLPLAHYAISSCLRSKIFKRVLVVSDSDHYNKILKKYDDISDFEFIKRPKSISLDNSPTEQTIDFILKKIHSHEITFLVQATSPLINEKDIKIAFKEFKKYKYDSLFSGYNFNKFYWTKDIKNNNYISHSYNYLRRPMRQQFAGGVVENGALYIFKTKKYFHFKNRLFGKIGCYTMPKNRSIDIDSIGDFKKVSEVLKSQ